MAKVVCKFRKDCKEEECIGKIPHIMKDHSDCENLAGETVQCTKKSPCYALDEFGKKESWCVPVKAKAKKNAKRALSKR